MLYHIIYIIIVCNYRSVSVKIDCGIDLWEGMDKAEDRAEDMETDEPVDLQQAKNVHCTNDKSVTEAEPTREDRTLTDHLNRRLLEHFMQRLDGNDPSFPKVNRIDTSDSENDLSNGVHKIEMNKN